jgi:hypothetical protein
VEYPGIDITQLSMSEYKQVREQVGIGVSRKEGRGIFDSVSSQSLEYATAAPGAPAG